MKHWITLSLLFFFAAGVYSMSMNEAHCQSLKDQLLHAQKNSQLTTSIPLYFDTIENCFTATQIASNYFGGGMIDYYQQFMAYVMDLTIPTEQKKNIKTQLFSAMTYLNINEQEMRASVNSMILWQAKLEGLQINFIQFGFGGDNYFDTFIFESASNQMLAHFFES